MSCIQGAGSPRLSELVSQMIKHLVLLVTLSLALAGCAAAPALDSGQPIGTSHVDTAAVERRPLPDLPLLAVPPAVPGSPFAPAAQPAIEVPPNTLYVCVVDAGGVRKQTAIEFAPKVGQICAKHPEMGPCQYERNACRRDGGRVYTTNGTEITMETETEYDKKVLRVRFKGG
jgi:hypothetical protein